MKKPTGLRLHLGILALVAVVTAGARVALRERHAQEFQRLGQVATNLRAREAEAAWKALAYADASEPGFTDTFLGKINWGSLPLSAVQQERLQTRLRQVVGYLLHPSFEDYFRLRTEGLHYQFQPSRAMNVMWTNLLHRSAADLAAQPLQAVHALWDPAVGPSNRFDSSRITAVCLTNVAAATSGTDTVHSLLSGPVRKGFTSAREALNPGFQYPGLERLSLSGSNAPLYFHLSFFAKASSGGAGPVYLSLCWLPEEQTWSLSRLLADTWLPLYTPF